LRYRHLLVRQMVQMKNRVSGLRMETGVEHNKQRLHKVGYFSWTSVYSAGGSCLHPAVAEDLRGIAGGETGALTTSSSPTAFEATELPACPRALSKRSIPPFFDRHPIDRHTRPSAVPFRPGLE